MDELILRLQQAGIIKAITEEEAANAGISIVSGDGSLSDPTERFAVGERSYSHGGISFPNCQVQGSRYVNHARPSTSEF
jgi:hypothetical protein